MAPAEKGGRPIQGPTRYDGAMRNARRFGFLLALWGALIGGACPAEISTYGEDRACDQDSDCGEGAICDEASGICLLQGQNPQADAGSFSSDASLPVSDAGPNELDAGTPPDAGEMVDSAVPQVDSGASMDAGPPPPDAGPPPPDAGPPPPDAGPPPPDAGPPPPDAGPPPPGSTAARCRTTHLPAQHQPR
jgi:hypothetical protein